MQVYLDNNSTTQVDKAVIEEMLPFFDKLYANPSSAHSEGDAARGFVEIARERVAKIISADPVDVYFTNSASEANNIVLKGICPHILRLNNKISFITTTVEHSSVLNCIKTLCNNTMVSAEVNFVSVDIDGNIDFGELERLLETSTGKKVVSIMAANNEAGTIYDYDRIGQLCKKHNAYFHCDATQAIGKVSIDIAKSNIDALTMSSHKIHGPKGAGAVYFKDVSNISPIIDGGYQNIITSGTINTPAIVGFGKACELLLENDNENIKIKHLRDYLLELLSVGIKDLVVNGTMNNRLCNNLNVSIPGVGTELVIKSIDDVMMSGSSACGSIGGDVSHVLIAMGAKYPECALRFGLSKFTTIDEVEFAASRIIKTANEVRG